MQHFSVRNGTCHIQNFTAIMHFLENNFLFLSEEGEQNRKLKGEER
jgi:hypothetical protein